MLPLDLSAPMSITDAVPQGLDVIRRMLPSLPLTIVITAETTMLSYYRNAHKLYVTDGYTYHPTPSQIQKYLSAKIAHIKKRNKAFHNVVVRRKGLSVIVARTVVIPSEFPRESLRERIDKCEGRLVSKLTPIDELEDVLNAYR